MDKNELIELFKDNSKEVKHSINASTLVEIGKYAFVSLRIDDKTLDYYYEIDIDELLSSDMSLKKYENLKDQGWSIDKGKLILFLT